MRSVDFFRECFYSSLTVTELRSRMQTIVDACGCPASKQSNSRDGGLISSLPIPYCTNSLLFLDFIHGPPRFGGYDSCLVVTCGLSRFTPVFPCSKKITGEQKLDGPTEAVSFGEHAYLYEHSVTKLNSGSEFPTLNQIQIQIPECTA